MENKSILKRLEVCLTTPKFKIKHAKENIYFNQELSGGLRQYFIGFSKASNRVFITGIGCRIRINAVENVFNKVIKGITKDHSRWTIILSIGHNMTIENMEDMENICCLLSNNLVKEILPFMNKYDNINEIDRHIDELKDEKIILSKFIYNYTNLKELIIRKLANNPGYQSLLEERKKFYREDFKEVARYFPNHDKIFEELLKVLEND